MSEVCGTVGHGEKRLQCVETRPEDMDTRTEDNALAAGLQVENTGIQPVVKRKKPGSESDESEADVRAEGNQKCSRVSGSHRVGKKASDRGLTSSKECAVRLVDIAAGFKRKFDEISNTKQQGKQEDAAPELVCKRRKPSSDEKAHDDREDDDDEDEDEDEEEYYNGKLDKPGTVPGAKKRKQSSPGMIGRLVKMEDRAPLCLLGETESNMFPKAVELLNHTIPVIYDSRVHVWFKADDFAKALGYKNYKSAVEKYINPRFVLPYPDVLDLSRARYGDAFRLYSVNNKIPFISEAGAVQLLFRWMISGQSQKQQATTPAVTSVVGQEGLKSGDQTATVPSGERLVKTPVVKPKLSADWINYQIEPSLMAFSDAARNGKTAKEQRNETA